MNYYATGKPNINVDVAERVVIGMIIGIGKGCEQSGCALIGGGGKCQVCIRVMIIAWRASVSM